MSDLANRNAEAMREALKSYQEDIGKLRDEVKGLKQTISTQAASLASLQCQVAVLSVRTTGSGPTA